MGDNGRTKRTQTEREGDRGTRPSKRSIGGGGSGTRKWIK